MNLNFGCGLDLKSGFVNVDADFRYGADQVCDMNSFPFPFKSGSADLVVCNMVLEHLESPTKVMEEFHRILKKDGRLEVVVPHFSALASLNADIHIRNYSVGYFWNYQKDDKGLFNRTDYDVWEQSSIKFRKVNVELLFPMGYLMVLSFPFQILFGDSKLRQGFYEHFLANFYRANEIHVKMIK